MSTSAFIETPRLLLQNLSVAEHAEGLHEIYSSEIAMKWMPTLFSKSIEETKDKLKYEIYSSERPWNQMYAILFRPKEENKDEKPRVIGQIGIKPHMACYLHPDFWGQGIAMEAARGSLKQFWALPEHKQKQTIKAFIDTNNIPSIKLAKKMGLEEGETYRKISGSGDVTEFFIPRPEPIPELVKEALENPFVIKKERFWMEHMDVEKHLNGYHELWKYPEVLKWTSIREGDVRTLENSRDHLATRVRSKQNPFVQHLAIVEPPMTTQSPGTKLRFIGSIGMYRFPENFEIGNLEPGEPEIGYAINPEIGWGKGYGTDAVRAFLEYYWRITEPPHVNVKSILAIYTSNNIASERVLEKAGFKLVEDDGMKNGLKAVRVQRPSPQYVLS